jgi:Tubulin-tyrosine ligase family.
LFIISVGNVPWIQPTYNLKTELNAFVGDYLERQAKSEDNFWILKPPTLSRSIDMVVTDKLDIILR